MQTELLLLFGLFACGAAAGLLAPRWTSLSGWAALAFPVVLPPLGFWLGCSFC
jgi:hypothetical protein